MVLKKNEHGKYKGDGVEVWVRAVDRMYEGKKRPVYYLDWKPDGAGGKYVYLSGLFETNNEKVFSGDVKDSVTGKRYFFITLNGDELLTDAVLESWLKKAVERAVA